MATDNGVNGDTIISNSKVKESSEKYTNKFDPNEISPLKIGQAKDNADMDTSGSQQVKINITQEKATDDPDTFVPKAKGKNKFIGTYEAVLTYLELSHKARTPFVVMVALCAILLTILVAMIAFWPRIPFYMKADLCVERECLESSSQILLWANTSVNVCGNPYEWACGRFENEFSEHLGQNSFGVTGGEWNLKTHADYEEISKIHAFIAQMPSTASMYSAQTMLKVFHSTCMASESLDKLQADTELKKAIFDLRGWAYGEDWQPNAWDFREAMRKVQAKYGVFPFIKFTVVNRNSAPFGNILKISEGEYGLPNKLFYNLDIDHAIVKAYKLLLRDFAINFGVVSDMARKFADEVFHFEKRIVNSLPDHRQHVILSLGDIQKKAPSLPITEIITTMFPKLNDKTKILVEDIQLLSQLSIIISTTDETPLNNFLTWSLSRQFLPFMSREYRAALQEFNSRLYGIDKPQPTWYFCTELLRNRMPLAVDFFRQNPRLIVVPASDIRILIQEYFWLHKSGSTMSPHYNNDNAMSDFLVQDITNYNHELIKMIFYHLRYQLKQSITDNVSIDQEITNFINDKLASMELQIGIPPELLKSDEYLKDFYKDFHWRKLHFTDNLENYWTFQKKKMESMLEPMKDIDKKIASLFSISGKGDKLVKYSVDINTILVSNRAVDRPFFHFKYPISVNFARIGVELSNALLEAVFLIGEQYKEDFYESHKLINKTRTEFSLGDTSCISKLADPKIPQAAKDHLITDVTSGRFVAKSLKEFLRLVETSQPIQDPLVSDAATFDLFNLYRKIRQPGLRQYDEMQLFSLVYMQRFCSVTSNHYTHFKSYVENELPARETFNINWNQISLIKKSLHCAVTQRQCEQTV